MKNALVVKNVKMSARMISKLVICPHCQNDDMKMIELIWQTAIAFYYQCNVCSKSFSIRKSEIN